LGLILDTCVLIDAERAGQNVLDLVASVRGRTGSIDLFISAVSLVEMAHGITRARSGRHSGSRRLFLNDLRSEIVIWPVTEEIAVRAGLLDGELQAKGVTVGLPDLLIGVTALHHGHGVLTSNVRHFKAIPGLEIVEL
jgi:predicted nucleic acid-binding protein